MSILTFQIPSKVVMERANDFHAMFTFKPLEKGYGVTIGNALRRILLSSLEGYAITRVRIPTLLHEFSTIEGVVEDFSEIILNLKKIRFKKVSEKVDKKLNIKIEKKTQFKAGDLLSVSSSFEILNPDLVICNLDEKASFEIELQIEKGRGYVTSEENKREEQIIGEICIDSIFTPIKNVKYSVENIRVEQKTDYEQLTIEVETDGSIHPEDALKEAANILIKHFILFSDQTMILQTMENAKPSKVDEEMLHMRKLLKTSIDDLDLSVRAYNCLKAADITILGELVKLEIGQMMKLRNFGKKSLLELQELVADKELEFGMDISKYNLYED